jgi:hypothetical protein
VEAKIVVADPDGRSSVAIWIAFDFRLCLWRWTVHLYSVLSQSKGIFAPNVLLPWFDPYQAGRVGPRRPTIYGLPCRDLNQGNQTDVREFWQSHLSHSDLECVLGFPRRCVFLLELAGEKRGANISSLEALNQF